MNLDQTPAPTPRRSNRRATIAIGVVLLGILALIYPVVSTHYNNYKQREFALKYGNNVQNIDTSEREAALEAAREYNKRLPGVPILDPWLTEVANPASPHTTNTANNYQTQGTSSHASASPQSPSTFPSGTTPNQK